MIHSDQTVIFNSIFNKLLMTPDNLKRCCAVALGHISRISNIKKCLLKFFNEIKDGAMDTESLIWIVFFCEINFENYFHFIFS